MDVRGIAVGWLLMALTWVLSAFWCRSEKDDLEVEVDRDESFYEEMGRQWMASKHVDGLVHRCTQGEADSEKAEYIAWRLAQQEQSAQRQEEVQMRSEMAEFGQDVASEDAVEDHAVGACTGGLGGVLMEEKGVGGAIVGAITRDYGEDPDAAVMSGVEERRTIGAKAKEHVSEADEAGQVDEQEAGETEDEEDETEDEEDEDDEDDEEDEDEDEEDDEDDFLGFYD